jgi:hypothetical protein
MVLDALPAQTQGSINSSRQPAKSPTFRVARAAPRDRAMAEMRASARKSAARRDAGSRRSLRTHELRRCRTAIVDHSSILVDGVGRRVSDKTFVSRMIM